MIRFLLKGLLRDKHRSLLPIIVVGCGVMLTVFMHAWFVGIVGDMLESNADYSAGHVKVMTRAYHEHQDQLPIDLALLGADTLITQLQREFPSMEWVSRINFGGLIDVPDSIGETKAQGPAMGMALDLMTPGTKEIERCNIRKGLVRGHLPAMFGEILISDEFASKLGIGPGSTVTLMTSTMYGSMSFQNYLVAGTIRFGIAIMDRGTVILDLGDARQALDMSNATGEILGYFSTGHYDNERAVEVASSFNSRYQHSQDRFAPVMLRLLEQNDLETMLVYIEQVINMMIVIFVAVMSIVLWNAGLIAGLRRYGEMGLRLAIGEEKHHVYQTLLIESAAVGLIGSIAGTIIGLGMSYWMQEVGFDFSSLMKNATMMVPAIFRAQITPTTYYIGFIPGLFSTILGTALSGYGIFKRNTARLFKELEA